MDHPYHSSFPCILFSFDMIFIIAFAFGLLQLVVKSGSLQKEIDRFKKEQYQQTYFGGGLEVGRYKLIA